MPTVRKLREIAFKVASRRVRAGRFLDLGAGNGTLGLEAISRGAMLSTFVERSARMCSFIKQNLATLGIKDGHGEVLECEVAPFLKAAARKRREWDLVFLGPREDFESMDLNNFLKRGVPLAPGGLLLLQHKADRELPEKFGALTRWRVISSGDLAITFYQRKGAQ